jgi:hypothetical protein
MTASDRTKGAVAERQIVAILRAAGWTHAQRTSNGRDQVGRGDILAGPPGTHIEIKRQERLNVPKALRQAIDDAHELDIPIVIHRPSRHDWMATLPLDDLLDLLALREL